MVHSLKNYLVATAMCLTTIGFTSCVKDDETSIQPARSIHDAHGKYTGVLTADKVFQDTVQVTIDSVSKTVQISKFPVKAIVRALVDSTQQAAALKSATECAVKMAYTGSVNSDIVRLQLGAQVMDFDMTVNEKVAKVKVFFGKNGVCLYNNTFKIVNVTLVADSLLMDGVKCKDVKSVQYLFQQTKK